MKGRQIGLLMVMLLGLVVVVGGWAIPNIAGAAFVDVRLVATPVSGGGAGVPRSAVLGNAGALELSRLKFAIRVDGGYPLPVVVAGDAMPLRVELRERGDDGASRLVWSITGSAATLDDGSDSPGGTAGDRAYLVRPGTIDFEIGPVDGADLLDAGGGLLSPGRYELRAVAFGIASGSLALLIVD